MAFQFIDKIKSYLQQQKEVKPQIIAVDKFKKKTSVPKKKISNDLSRKNQALKDSQGKDDFSGSSYNGPGNVDHEKTNSNMAQRNFKKT